MIHSLAAAATTIAQQLPVRARWWILGVVLEWRFEPERWMWMPGDEIECSPGTDPSWRNLRIFGESRCDGGASPLIAIRESDGAVCGLDVESDRAVFTYNSSLEAFCATFALADSVLSNETIEAVDLGSRARALDPGAYATSEWAGLFDVVDPRHVTGDR